MAVDFGRKVIIQIGTCTRSHWSKTHVLSELIIKITISSIVIGLKKLLFSTKKLANLLSDSLLLDSLLSDSSISQSHSKL